MQYRDRDASFVGEVRHQETIAAIVARATQYLDMLGSGPDIQQAAESGAGRPGHQGNAWYPVIMNGAVI